MAEDHSPGFESSRVAYQGSLAAAERSRQRVLKATASLQRQGQRWLTRLRRLLIITRMDEGRLPGTLPSVVSGEPGFGGQCDACDGYMPATQVMMIPNAEAFAYLHADCYLIFTAQCQLRASRRRITKFHPFRS
jgi:hypothetical protein